MPCLFRRFQKVRVDSVFRDVARGCLGLSGDAHRIHRTINASTERMLPGHVSIPNDVGLDNEDGTRSGIAPNELTSLDDRDKFAGTPHHKFVPANIEAVA